MEGKIIQCRNCGKEFVREKNSQKYCSVQCRDEYYKRENRNLTNKYECKWCGVEFKSLRKRKYCCDRCRLKANGRLLSVPKKKAKNFMSIEEVARASREAGLSYGLYVAQMGL